MNQVAILTELQKNELIGQKYTDDCYFNPIQDCNDNWIISIQEIEFCINPDFQWVKDLIISDFCPKPITPPF